MHLSQKDFRSLQQAIFRLHEPRNVSALRHDLPRILAKLTHRAGGEAENHRAVRSLGVSHGAILGGNTERLTQRERSLLQEIRRHVEQAFRTAELITSLQNLKSTPARHASLDRLFRFSARECEVAHWLAQGKSNSEIGMILNVSPRTVEKHVEHILDKLGVENRTTAAAMLARINLVSLSK